MTRPSESQEEAFWHLLYRYFWPFQYFRDAGRGSRIEQAMNYRHNRAMRGCLPGFALKWMSIAALDIMLGANITAEAGLAVLAAACYTAAIGSMLLALQLVLAWAWLTRFPERF